MKIDNCSFPEDLLYDTENFVWISNKGKKTVTIGITVIMTSIAGKLSSIKLKPVGTKLEKGKSCGVLESVKYFGVVRTPVSGTIVQVNNSLIHKPKLANDFPYTEGWLVKVEPLDIGDLKALETIENCHDKMRLAIQKLRVRCFAAFPDNEMFEIVVECSSTLQKLNERSEKIPAGEVI